MKSIIYNWLFPLNKAESEIVDTVSNCFSKNKRIEQLIGCKKKKASKLMRTLISYSYLLVKKVGGVFQSAKGSSYIFYYRQKELSFTFWDRARLVVVAFSVVGLSNLWLSAKREKRIKETRKKDLQKNSRTDFLYVWYLAQAKSYNALDAIMEMKRFIIDKADYLNLPIYMETTEDRLVPLYTRMGFKFYNSYKEEGSDYTVHFGKYEPFLLRMSEKIAA